MAKTKPKFKLRMKDGSVEEVEGTKLNDNFHYHKSENLYWLTHTPSGRLVTSAKKVKSLRELINEPEFFDDNLTVTAMHKAYVRWANRNMWKM